MHIPWVTLLTQSRYLLSFSSYMYCPLAYAILIGSSLKCNSQAFLQRMFWFNCNLLQIKIIANIINMKISLTLTYTCQLSRLRIENFDLTPAHACGPISHAWWKNVSCCRLAINDNTFLVISDFMDKRFLDNFAVGRLRMSSDFFGRLWTSSGIFGNDRVVFKNPSTPRIKISRLYLRKSWHVCNR